MFVKYFVEKINNILESLYASLIVKYILNSFLIKNICLNKFISWMIKTEADLKYQINIIYIDKKKNNLQYYINEYFN